MSGKQDGTNTGNGTPAAPTLARNSDPGRFCSSSDRGCAKVELLRINSGDKPETALGPTQLPPPPPA